MSNVTTFETTAPAVVEVSEQEEAELLGGAAVASVTPAIAIGDD